MNYIRHLTAFFERVSTDERLNPTHVSLYISLFQYWNINRFNNPISITRDEVMRISKICAKATYHKCIKDLHNYGYVVYKPSFNPFRGSLVHLMDFEPKEKAIQKSSNKQTKNQTANEQALNSNITKIETGIEQALVPSINKPNITNDKNIVNGKAQNENENEFDLKILKPISKNISEKEEKEKLRQKKKFTLSSVEGKEKSSAKKERKKINNSEQTQKPELNSVQEYFVAQNYPSLEAEKFYNYFQSNGWLVSGKTQMKDWQAAARNWMLNTQKFNNEKTKSPQHSSSTNTRAKQLHTTTNKNYNEPL